MSDAIYIEIIHTQNVLKAFYISIEVKTELSVNTLLAFCMKKKQTK